MNYSTTSSMMNKYTIAEFSNGFQLVPSSWIANGFEAYWPSYMSVEGFANAVSSCAIPQFSWKVVPLMRIMETASSYADGMAKLRLIQQSSIIDNRTLINNQNDVVESFQNYDETEQENHHEITLPQSIQISECKEEPLSDEEESIPSKRPKTTSSRNSQDNNTIMGNISNDIVVDFMKKVLSKLNRVANTLDRMDTRLSKIEDKLVGSNTTPQNDYFNLEDIVPVPLNSKEDIVLMENNLADPTFYDKVVTFFTHLGGRNVRHLVTSILKHIISNYLSTQYCWNGMKGKKDAFKDTLLAKSIKQAAHMKFSTDDAEIIEIVSKWFIQGKLRYDRDLERSQRQPT